MRDQGCGCPWAHRPRGYSAHRCVTTGPLPGLSLGTPGQGTGSTSHSPYPESPVLAVGAPVGQGRNAGDKLRTVLAHSVSMTRALTDPGGPVGSVLGQGVQGPPNPELQASLALWRVRAGAAGGVWA